jgi:hypothetical protein
MRQFVALCLLLLTTLSNLETVTGLLRDGAVHHEDAVAASAHADFGGEHGHEDASSPSEHRHNEDHEHGTSSDHCTHHHGIALVPSLSFLILGTEVVIHSPEALLPQSLVSATLVHPPRA